ncbi:RagB/SusD family nutrient uptake outer membrane protein [Prevotella sp. 10(H)]|uniref:RagB/SusD family nutrient uptake outer membrane protein n=1 Tax=Prevotella sp. 10(H) TaxID=1158294 RepID=UPI0004A6CDE4|nr:RagB/SusD family nutrient uptake outer membrane protein [Prevotella sp. 10(H)]
MKKHILKYIVSIFIITTLIGCNDFLDKEPLSQITPEVYLTEESQLAAYANGLYPDLILSHSMSGNYGIFDMDKHTDNMAERNYDNRYVPGQWKVEVNGGDWEFSKIFSCNYFFDKVMPKYEEGSISGNPDNIKHYIGEMHFLRALAYFDKLQKFGDYPIITTVLPDEKAPLIEASKRSPRNEVARFIISDLDNAITLLLDDAPGGRNRISKPSAQLFKSRAALFEGTWLKYFKNTAFVPNGKDWPGAKKDYNSGYTFPSGSIDNEIDFFLTEAMSAASAVADKIELVENNGVLQQSVSDPVNPYHDMFGSEDLSGYDEVLLWRRYDKGLGLVHGAVQQAQLGNGDVGTTRGMVNSYLMANGLPIYAPGAGYSGDDYISDVRKNRDGRLWLFLKEPGQINVLYESSEGTHATPIEIIPNITNRNYAYSFPTGYVLRKGNNYDAKHCGSTASYTASIAFRAVEAYLNYMEACYEKNGTIDGKADGYWKKIRNRAKVDPDYTKTIAATNMSEEAKYDWGAYSGNQLINPTLYNIRRERRSELIAEGLRYMDLKRWRAMDQMISTPYHIEGFKLWGPMKEWYNDKEGKTILSYGLDNTAANVSSPTLSEYLRPYEISSKSLVVGGYKWAMAHYLSPIHIQHFLITSQSNDVSTSPIYQNPGWPIEANQGAIN